MRFFERKVQIKSICIASIVAAGMLPFGLFAADPKIDVDVVSGAGGYKLVFRNSECPSEPGHMGCVEVAKGSKNWIMWELSNQAARDGWQLASLEMNLAGLADPALRDCAASDFDLDPSNGRANGFQVQGNGRSAKNWDENGCDVAYQVAYLLYAENPGMNQRANSDPVIKNGGKQ